MASKAPAAAKKAANPLGKAFVRVTGTRLGRFVEFEFSVNDADLTVELVLPFAAFDEFRAAQHATVLPTAPDAAVQMETLAWRSRQPGLLRRIEDAADDTENEPSRKRRRHKGRTT